MRVFLAFQFNDGARDIVKMFERLLRSHDIRHLDGEDLGGGEITPAVRERIDEAAGLIALLTRNEAKSGGGWTASQWVQDELNIARNQDKFTIAFVEEGVDVGGAYEQHEFIRFERNDLLDPFLKLSAAIGLWKAKAGRRLKWRLQPDELARSVARNGAKCIYRFFTTGRYTDWEKVTPIPEPGGTFIYVDAVKDDYTIQLEVHDGKSLWTSPATPQWMYIELEQRANP